MNAISGCLRSAGRTFSEAELRVVTEVVTNGDGRSRAQLMVQVCQRLQWRRSSGALKVRECRDLLLTMERDDRLRLPPKRAAGRPRGARTRVPFGAQLRYLAFVSQPTLAVVAALQVSSPAWRLAARDRWIGWDEPTRLRHLQRVVNNSRFLVLPWVRVNNLASRLLALLAKRLAADWHARFAIEPLLIETLVDRRRFAGTCYRAANWIELGDSSGRGRMDRAHARHGQAPKRVLVYPLVADAQRRLVEAW